MNPNLDELINTEFFLLLKFLKNVSCLLLYSLLIIPYRRLVVDFIQIY